MGSTVISVVRLPISRTGSTTQVIQGTSCSYGNWVEDVRAGLLYYYYYYYYYYFTMILPNLCFLKNYKIKIQHLFGSESSSGQSSLRP